MLLVWVRYRSLVVHTQCVFGDPAKLTSYQLTPSDIATALQAQNSQVAVGQLGGAPAVQGQVLNATVNAQSLLQTPEQFKISS